MHVEQQGSIGCAQAAAGRHGSPPAVQRLMLKVLPDVLRLLRPSLGKPRELRRQSGAAPRMPPMTFNEGGRLAGVRLAQHVLFVPESDAHCSNVLRRVQHLRQTAGGTPTGMACQEPPRRRPGLWPPPPAACGAGCYGRSLACRGMPRCGAHGRVWPLGTQPNGLAAVSFADMTCPCRKWPASAPSLDTRFASCCLRGRASALQNHRNPICGSAVIISELVSRSAGRAAAHCGVSSSH